jgi:hypothetical protein
MLSALLLDLVALVGGTVHPMETGAEPRAATVLVRDGVIEALLAPDAALPEDARRVDVTGKHVVPGLIDGMVYFDGDHDALYVAQGVTTIRDLGGDAVVALIARAPEQRDRVPGPHLLTPGPVVDGDPPSSPKAAIVRTPGMADELLPIFFNEEVDFLSVQQGIDPEPFRRVAELAHAEELEVWGPVPRALSLAEALTGPERPGLDGVLFLDGLLPDGIAWEKVLPGGLRKGVEALAAGNTPIVPVLLGTALRTVDQAQEREAAVDLELLDPMYAAQWEAELEFRRTLFGEGYVATGERVVAKQLELLRQLDEAGVPLVPGSGAPHAWLFPGVGLHQELALWERAGLAPYDVLARATRESARILGVGDSRGTIAPGKVADLVVVAGDPREGVAALRDPELVVLRGHVLDRARLNDMLATVRARNDARREKLATPIEVEPPDLPEGAVVLQGKVDVIGLGQRIRAERFAVVREPDGALTYVGRTRFGGAEDADRETRVLQRTRDGKLDEFLVELQNGEDEIRSHGIWTASHLSIERRAGGVPIDTRRVRDRVTCVDVGSVTSALLLTQLVRTEPFQILTFHELLEPELAVWAMAYGGEGELVHYVRTHKGVTTFQSTKHGAVERMRSAVGGGVLDTILVEEDALGGAGLPPPAEKLELVQPLPPDGAPPAESGEPGDAPGAGDEDGGDDPAPEAGGGSGDDPSDGRGEDPGDGDDPSDGKGEDPGVGDGPSDRRGDGAAPGREDPGAPDAAGPAARRDATPAGAESNAR